jgi:hypothetical protein
MFIIIVVATAVDADLKIELETATRTCSFGFVSLLTHIHFLLYEKLLSEHIVERK